MDAAQAAIVGGDPARAIATSLRARALARRAGGRAAKLADFHHAVVLLAARGGRAERGTWSHLDRLPARDASEALEILLLGATALYWSGDNESARWVLERVVMRARADRAPMLGTALDTLAAVLFRLGDWPTADGLSAEALRIARARRVDFDTASAATTLARIAAARGDEAECRALLNSARRLARRGSLAAAYVLSASGLLELSLGRPDAAARELEKLATGTVSPPLSPLVNQWLPELIESYVRAGRPRDALSALARLEAAVRPSDGPLLRALAARSRGLLAPTNTLELHFGGALRLHDRTDVPFERARTELCYGERLRRARRRPEAIAHLQAALAVFERIGAAPWADRARGELGPLRRSATGAGIEQLLTTHELAVAAHVQRGATNREAANALFVTPKTIEYHLAQIFRKTGVRSRTELVIALFRAERRPA